MISPNPAAEPSQVVSAEQPIPTSQSVGTEATLNIEQDASGETKQETTLPVVASVASTSTFRALAAVSYAERIRTSVPVVDNAVRKAAMSRDEASSSGKSSMAVISDGKLASVKRTGRNKSGSSSAPKRPAEVFATFPVIQSSGQGSNPIGSTSEEAEQGWQEVTGKHRSHQSSKGDKKEAGNISNANARQRQHAKKALINGIPQDDDTSQDRPAKGKSAGGSRKDQDRSDKDFRHQHLSHDDGSPTEPTRRQQQQQKEKNGTSPKSLGMKAASWRSSPHGAQTVSSPKQEMGAKTTSGLSEAMDKFTASNASSQELATEHEANIIGVNSASASAVPAGNDPEDKPPSASGTGTGTPNGAKSEAQPSPAAPPVNVWQLRKEKMKSTSAKQVKSSVGNGKTVFNTLSETTSVPQPQNGNMGKKNSIRVEETQGKILPAASAGPVPTQTASSPSAGKVTTSKQMAKLGSAEAVSAPSGRRDVTSSGPINVSSKAPGGPPSRLADGHLWPDIAASAARSPGSVGTEGKKKEKEHDENLRVAATRNKKEKKKWTPIPPAEMQEAFDKAEKARKAALQSGVEGAKQKRAASTSTGLDDAYHVPGKTSTKRNAQGSAKATGKATTSTSAEVAKEISSRKTKAPAFTSSKQTNAVKADLGIATSENTSIGSPSGLAPVCIDDSRASGPSQVPDRGIDAASVNAGDRGDASVALAGELENQQAVPFSPHGAEVGSPKRKALVTDRPKGHPAAATRASGSSSIINNHLVQTRDVGRGGFSGGRGGRGHGGKMARGGAIPSGSKYGDGGMAMSPRGHSKSALLSPPPGVYNGLPFESSMAAAVNAPGFVPFSGQAPYSYYNQGYYYGGSANGTGMSSSGSDSGYDPAANGNGQQSGQQAFMPYNMAFMPQQRPVTEIPGLDPLRFYILGQIEYYFSIHNLCMDQFLKGQMDAHGWVDISMIASFNRIRQVTTDEELVQEVAQLSQILEVRDKKMRLRDNWQMWIFPNAKPSVFPETENTSATRLEELALHGVRVADLSEETRERIVGDIQRDILRSTSGLASMPPTGILSVDTVIEGSNTTEAEEKPKVTAKSSPATSVVSDSSSDKLDIIV